METFEEFNKKHCELVEDHCCYIHDNCLPCLSYEKIWNHQQQKIDELTEALRFYANRDNYDAVCGTKTRTVERDCEDVAFPNPIGTLLVGGKRARQALEKLNIQYSK